MKPSGTNPGQESEIWDCPGDSGTVGNYGAGVYKPHVVCLTAARSGGSQYLLTHDHTQEASKARSRYAAYTLLCTLWLPYLVML